MKRLQKVTFMEKEEDESMKLEKEDVCVRVEECLCSCLGHICDTTEFPLHLQWLLIKQVWKVEKLKVIKIRVRVV